MLHPGDAWHGFDKLEDGYCMLDPIKVTVLYPGYIVSEMSATSKTTPLVASTERGVRAMVAAIEKEKSSARVPAWPWVPIGFALEHLPLPIARKLMG